MAKTVESKNRATSSEETRREVLAQCKTEGIESMLLWFNDLEGHLKSFAITPDEIASGTDGAVAKLQGLHEKTPLWYYILKEAQVRSGGERLGPVGARIVAEAQAIVTLAK